MSDTYWEIAIPHESGNWGICKNQSDAMLYIVNRFGKASGFTQETPFTDMFFWSPTNKAWTWKGNFQNGIYIREQEWTGFSAPGAPELILRINIPDLFYEKMQRKEFEKYGK